MVTCSKCGETISNGHYCYACDKFYCNNHPICHICGRTGDYEVSTEVYSTGEINWINSSTTKLGISGFDLYVPFDFTQLFSTLPTEKIHVIIFDTKIASNNYKDHLIEKYYLRELDNTVYTEKSRYTIFKIPQLNEDYILINNNAVRSVEEIAFIIKFASKCVIKTSKYDESDFLFVDNNLYEIYYDYFDKFIPDSRIISVEMKDSKQIIKRKILSSYVEVESLKECYNNETKNLVYRFLIERIKDSNYF